MKNQKFKRCPVCGSKMKWYEMNQKSYLKETKQKDVVFPNYVGTCSDCSYVFRTDDQLIKSEEAKR